jgi:DNA-dependent RNA polymerase auxiliary subunit epsilon
MKSKQVSALRPIIDVDEAEASYAESQEEMRRREEVRSLEIQLQEASESLRSLSATKVRQYYVAFVSSIHSRCDLLLLNNSPK